jgi:adenylyl-sulfate kinase
MNSFLPDIDFWSAKAASLLDVPSVIWIMGKPSSGKTSLAKALSEAIVNRGFLCKTLDGDDLRNGLNVDLTFTEEDRTENLRRAAEVAKILAETHIVTIASFITPLEYQRSLIKSIMGSDVKLVMIGLETSQAICIERDVKGLYAMAKSGKITGLTGYDAPFEAYDSADLVIDTGAETLEESKSAIMNYINQVLK